MYGQIETTDTPHRGMHPDQYHPYPAHHDAHGGLNITADQRWQQLTELIHGMHDNICALVCQDVVGQRPCIHGHCEAASSDSGTHTKRGVLYDNGLPRLGSCLLHAT